MPIVKLSTLPVKVPPVPTFGPRPNRILASGYPVWICAHVWSQPAAWKVQLNSVPTPVLVVEYQVPSAALKPFQLCHMLVAIGPLGTKTNVVYDVPVPCQSTSML